jgi:hypothetical protein
VEEMTDLLGMRTLNDVSGIMLERTWESVSVRRKSVVPESAMVTALDADAWGTDVSVFVLKMFLLITILNSSSIMSTPTHQ